MKVQTAQNLVPDVDMLVQEKDMSAVWKLCKKNFRIVYYWNMSLLYMCHFKIEIELSLLSEFDCLK